MAVAGTLGAVTVIIGIDTVAVDGGKAVDDAGIQRRHRHRRLEGGAGGVQTLQRAVEQGQARVRAVLAVLGGEEVLVVAGVVGGGQHTAVLRADDHHRTGGSLGGTAAVVGAVYHLDVPGQRPVHRLLEGAVDGELDGMARLRHGGHRSPHDDAVRAAGDGLNAVLAPQLVFVDGFEARHADHVVHVIALFPQRVGGLAVLVGHLPLFGGDLAHTAQHMGDDAALIVAAGAGLYDLHTGHGQAVLLDGRHGHFADILGHDEVVDVGERLLLHLVVDAAQHPLPVERIAFQLVVLHQLFHHVIGGGVLL